MAWISHFGSAHFIDSQFKFRLHVSRGGKTRISCHRLLSRTCRIAPPARLPLTSLRQICFFFFFFFFFLFSRCSLKHFRTGSNLRSKILNKFLSSIWSRRKWGLKMDSCRDLSERLMKIVAICLTRHDTKFWVAFTFLLFAKNGNWSKTFEFVFNRWFKRLEKKCNYLNLHFWYCFV